MAAKTSVLQSGVLALFVSIPLYRPILMAHNLIYLVYAIFVFGFLILSVNFNVIRYSNPTQLLLLTAYTVMSVLASLFAVQGIRLDGFGLLCFLPISYLLGVGLGVKDSAHWFFRWLALIFLPIAFYVVYQLSKNSFSYNTYYYWSAAAYKIDYLTTSLYAGVLLLYFFFNGRSVVEKYGLAVFCFGFIAISGARYSIIFAACAGVSMMLRTATKAPARLIAGFVMSSLILVVLVLSDETAIDKFAGSVNYSLFRLENLSEDDNSVEGRMVLMKKAGRIISEHFTFGVGLAGSGDALKSNYPHNLLLEAFIDSGIFSVLPLLMFLVYSVYLLVKSTHGHKVWCLLLVLYVLGAFLKSFSIYESRILFFFIGYAATLVTREVLVWESEVQGKQYLAFDTRGLNSTAPLGRP